MLLSEADFTARSDHLRERRVAQKHIGDLEPGSDPQTSESPTPPQWLRWKHEATEMQKRELHWTHKMQSCCR